jgi:hypothetical protein
MERIRRILKSIEPTRREGFKSPLRQYLEMLWLGAFWRLSPIEYRTYQFGRKGTTREEMKSYLRIVHAEKQLRPTLNAREWAPLLENKLMFNSYYSQRGIPVTKLYGMFHPQYGSDVAGNPLRNRDDLRSLLERDDISEFVVKPLAGDAGTAVLVLELKATSSQDMLFADREGKEYTLDSLVKHISRPLHYRHQGFLIEERIVGHPNLARFNPSSVNTCRVVTFLKYNGEVEIALAVLRLGVKGKNTDNWHTGGIAAAIDPQTGIIGEGAIRPEFGGSRHALHPDSGLAFRGEKIPDWDKIVALTLKAARMTPFIRTVGWDVAATPTGPVIIEANFNWGPVMCQACLGGMLTSELRTELKKFGLEFPS